MTVTTALRNEIDVWRMKVWDEELLSTVDMRTERPRTESEVWAAIQNLDMGPIRMKLADPKEGMGWAEEDLNEVERWYKRYLFLHFKYPTKRIVPTKTIDAFWHQHILDTRKYARDCEEVFGFFLHHFPYFGMRGEEDAANLEHAFEETLRLFESEFGDSPVGMRISSHCRGGGNCDRGCTRCD